MFDIILDPRNIIAAAVAIAVFATVLTIAIPIFVKDPLNKRMKSVALEREKLRQQERQRLADDNNKSKQRTKAVKREPGQLLKTIVEKLNLKTALVDEKMEASLVQAGFRGPSPLFIFLGIRLGLPFLFGGLAALYIYVIAPIDDTAMKKLIYCVMAGSLGFYIPILALRKLHARRQLSITRAWPDALDLTLICVESGMSIEAAFRKVAAEIGTQSLPLAEELMITTAELSFLQERRQAYDNLTYRTGLEAVKNVNLSLIQAEKYGTPLAAALRVLSQENRDQRMSMAEKKAASLPPKLTVPMMVCFLPVLFCVILAPAIIRTMQLFANN